MSTAGVDTSGPTDRPRETSSPVDLPPETAFMVLKNARRRAVIEYLVEIESETDLDTLAEHLAAAENGVDVKALSSVQRKRVYIGLYQAHLPKLDDANVIDFDQPRGRVELRPEVDQLLPYLRTDAAGGSAPGAYLAVAVLTVAAVAMLAAVSPAASSVPVIGLAPVFVVSLHCFGACRRGDGVDDLATAGVP